LVGPIEPLASHSAILALAPQANFAASGIEVTFGDDDDVADLVAERHYLAQRPHACWTELAPRSRRRLRNRAKRWLNTLAVDRMTAQQFAERDPAGEIHEWLRAIAEMIAGGS
jgi:hypothetical protein